MLSPLIILKKEKGGVPTFPLIFYNKITALATANLLPNGRLYFEINEKFAKEVSDILEFHNFSNIIVHNDMQGKARIISGKMKN